MKYMLNMKISYILRTYRDAQKTQILGWLVITFEHLCIGKFDADLIILMALMVYSYLARKIVYRCLTQSLTLIWCLISERKQ